MSPVMYLLNSSLQHIWFVKYIFSLIQIAGISEKGHSDFCNIASAVTLVSNFDEARRFFYNHTKLWIYNPARTTKLCHTALPLLLLNYQRNINNGFHYLLSCVTGAEPHGAGARTIAHGNPNGSRVPARAPGCGCPKFISLLPAATHYSYSSRNHDSFNFIRLFFTSIVGFPIAAIHPQRCLAG